MLNLIFYHLDLFKAPFLFSFSPKRNYISTLTGFLVSLLIYFIITILFFTSDYYHGRNPKVTSDVLTLNQRPLLRLNKSNFEMSFGIFDGIGLEYEIDESILNITIYNATLNYSDSKIPKLLMKNFHKCDPNDLSKLELIKNGRSQIYCFDDVDLDLDGFLNNKISKSFFIEISKCNNSFFSQKCKSEEEIQSFLQYKYFSLAFIDYSIDNLNLDHPFSVHEKVIYFLLDSNFFKRIETYFRKSYVVTDNNMFADAKVEEAFAFEQNTLDSSQINAKTSSSHLIFQMELLTSLQIQKNTRVYQNIPELLAYLGAVFNVLVLIGKLLLSIKKPFDIMCFILKRTIIFERGGFSIGDAKKNNNFELGISKDKEILNETQNLKNQSLLLSSKLEKTVLGPKLNIEMIPNHSFRKRKNSDGEFKKITLIPEQKIIETFHINFFNFLKIKFFSFFCKKKNKEKEKLILETEKFYDQITEISFILKKIMEIEVLKEILLTPKQKKLFNLINEPMLNFPTFKGFNDCKLIDSEEKREKGVQKLILEYENFYSYNDLREKEKKLFNLLKINTNI